MIRGAAKWFIGAAAAVATVLLAGSQLSNIGKLDACSEWGTLRCARLPIAGVGAVVGLAAVAFIASRAVRILLPVGVTIDDLDTHWDLDPPRADVAFFKAHPMYLAYPRPRDLLAARNAAWDAAWEAQQAPDQERKAAREQREENAESLAAEFQRLDAVVSEVTAVAQHELLAARFRRMMWELVAAAAVTGVAIVAFAWAANPPPPPAATADLSGARLVGADLRDADLRNADLRGADLTNANLAGANVTGATLKDVVWHNTTCPDGSNSAHHEGTCLGHLDR